MRWQVGTSGFSYDAWKGPFYPEGLPARKRLAFYADRLPSVEISNTFYRLPRASMLAGWAEQVPEDFRFALKASRRITHFSRLRETDELVGVLLGAAEALASRLLTLVHGEARRGPQCAARAGAADHSTRKRS